MNRKNKTSCNDTKAQQKTTSNKMQPVASTSSENCNPLLDVNATQGNCKSSNSFSDAKESHDIATDEYRASVDPTVISEEKMKAINDAAIQFESYITGILYYEGCNTNKLIHIWDYVKSVHAEDILRYVPSNAREKSPPSVIMLIALINLGVSIKGIDNTGIAEKVFDLIISRQTEGLSTPKQIRVLLRHGFKNVGTWSKSKAMEMISYITQNDWKIPDDIDPETY